MNLKGKNILVFSPYGTTKHYGDAIINELEKRGAKVYGYDERPSQTTLMKIIIRLFKKKLPLIFEHYCHNIIKKLSQVQIDYILICRGEAFTPLTLQNFRKNFPQAKIILFFWDLLRCNDVHNNIPYADKAFSFDPEDVDNNEGLIFRPTFFVNQYKSIDTDTLKLYDIMFIGTLHSNRHKIIKNFKNKLNEQGFSVFLYLFVPGLIVYLKDFILKFPYININRVKFNPISISQTIEILSQTKAILDINYTQQKSLSTRAYEAMAAKRKYITTNPEVKKYDFYNPNNILIVDINNLNIPKDFLNRPFEPISEEILYRYSVEGLIDDLFSEEI